MMKILSALALSVAISAFSQIPIRPELRSIYDASVFIRASDGDTGSGSVFRSKAGEYLILTAAHVGWDTPWEPVIISQSIMKDGQKTGEYATLADVLTASHPYRGYDIAVLKPRDTIFTNAISFHLGDNIPAVGTPIWHCGSPRGAWLERSITFGHIAGLNRRRKAIQPHALDQSTATVLPGSSGGGLFLATSGEFVGFVDEWDHFDNINFFVPVRDILIFLRTEKIID